MPSISIYACRLPVPPKTINHTCKSSLFIETIGLLTRSLAVSLVGQVLADFTQLNLNEFNHRMVDGRIVYRFECRVETTVDAERNILQFAVEALGKTIGNECLEMRDIDLQTRPWANCE